MIFYKKCNRNHEIEFAEGEAAPTHCTVCKLKLSERVYIRRDRDEAETYEEGCIGQNIELSPKYEQKEHLTKFAFNIPKLNRLLEIPDGAESVILGRAGLGAEEELWGYNISRQHLLLEPMQGGVFITDMGSANGTSYRGERLEKGARRFMMPGDSVILDANISDIELILVKE